MKISLLWCLDHLEHNLDKDFNCLIDFAKNLCSKYNVSIGEIESCLDVKYKFDLIRGNFKSTINGKTIYIIEKQEVIINTDLERDAWFVHDTCYRLANYKDINGIKDDNRICNLRSVTNQQNCFNRTNAKGYTWNKRHSKWMSKIKVNSKTINLGYYNTEQEARNAYLAAKEIYHKF